MLRICYGISRIVRLVTGLQKGYNHTHWKAVLYLVRLTLSNICTSDLHFENRMDEAMKVAIST